MDFAKDILKDHEKDWGKFPIYLKATAGMRQLSYNDREAILRAVRDFLGDPKTCPFYFQFDQARVISGEEVGFAGRVPTLGSHPTGVSVLFLGGVGGGSVGGFM